MLGPEGVLVASGESAILLIGVMATAPALLLLADLRGGMIGDRGETKGTRI